TVVEALGNQDGVALHVKNNRAIVRLPCVASAEALKCLQIRRQNASLWSAGVLVPLLNSTGINRCELGGSFGIGPARDKHQTQASSRISLRLDRVVPTPAPVRVDAACILFAGILLGQHIDVELSNRADVEAVVILKNLL